MSGRKIVTTLLAAMTLLMNRPTTFAQTNTSILVKPVYSANQKPGVKGYFDVPCRPNQTHVLHVQITNPLSKTINVTMRSSDAYTSPQGGIVYDVNADSPDSSITNHEYRLSGRIRVPSQVTVSPGQVIDVPITVTAPNLDTGTLIGGVQFVTQGKTNTSTQQTQNGKANFVIKTVNVLSMAIQLDLPNPAPSNFTFGDAGFESENGQGYIVMQNNAPIIQTGISGTYQVTGNHGKQIFAGKINTMKMAPMTQIRYVLPWNQSTLSAGSYTLRLNAVVAGTPLKVSRNISIEHAQVQQYQNTHPVSVVQTGTPRWIWALVASGVVVVGAFMFSLGRKKRNL